jgi:hypothetical protein
MSKYGPNVTKLIVKFIAREAIPPGGGVADGIEFIRNSERREQVLKIAEFKAIQSLQLIKKSPDNPFGNDDEQIAGELLKMIEEKNRRNG